MIFEKRVNLNFGWSQNENTQYFFPFRFSPGTATVSLEDSVQPTTTMKFTNGADNKDGSAVTSATLGELLRLHIYIPDNFLGM